MSKLLTKLRHEAMTLTIAQPSEETEGFAIHKTYEEFLCELIVKEVLSLQNRHGNIKPKTVRSHFEIQDPDVPTEDEAQAAYQRLVDIGIIRPHERTLEGAEKDSVYEIILQSIPHAVSNNQRSITEEYIVSGKRYDLHWFGEGDYMIVEINK